MNKFLAIVLLAFVAVAYAGPTPQEEVVLDEPSEMAPLTTTDNQETAFLKGNQTAFAEYCIATRNELYTDIKRGTDAAASKAYQMLFGTLAVIGNNTVSTLKEAIDRIAASLNDPKAEIQPAENEISQALVDAQKDIQASDSQAQGVSHAVTGTFNAMKKSITNAVLDKYNVFSEAVKGPKDAMKGISSACKQIASYDAKFEQQFNEFKEENSEVEDVAYVDIQCATVRRIARIHSICRIFESSLPYVPKLISGINFWPKAAPVEETEDEE